MHMYPSWSGAHWIEGGILRNVPYIQSPPLKYVGFQDWDLVRGDSYLCYPSLLGTAKDVCLVSSYATSTIVLWDNRQPVQVSHKRDSSWYPGGPPDFPGGGPQVFQVDASQVSSVVAHLLFPVVVPWFPRW